MACGLSVSFLTLSSSQYAFPVSSKVGIFLLELLVVGHQPIMLDAETICIAGGAPRFFFAVFDEGIAMLVLLFHREHHMQRHSITLREILCGKGEKAA